VRTAARQLAAANPILAEAERTFPGICDRLAQEMQPVFARHHQRTTARFRPRATALLQAMMSPEEAAAIAQFYRSPLGAKLARAVETDPAARVSPASLASALDREEVQYIDRFFGRGAGRKLTPLLPSLTSLRAEMSRAPFSAADKRELKAIVERAVRLYKVLPDPPSSLPPPKRLKLGPMPVA
jgi:hypothetical protein